MEFRAEDEDAGKRLDVFLVERMPETSRSRIQHWIEDGRVLVDSAPTRRSTRLKGGELIQAAPAPPPPLDALPEPIPLDVLFEDDDIAAINKPAGMMVHGGAGGSSGTLVNALLDRFERNLSGVGGELRPGIVHRLDRFTSGVILVAKHDRAHRRLARSFEKRRVRKIYRAIVHGEIAPPEKAPPHRKWRAVKEEGVWWMRLEARIGRDHRNRVKMAVTARGREAVTDCRPLAAHSRFAHLELRIHTGRTHQIRVHLAWIGHPVVGDRIYGAPVEAPPLGRLDRFLLHAAELRLDHPITSEPLVISAPPPEEFQTALDKLGLGES